MLPDCSSKWSAVLHDAAKLKLALRWQRLTFGEKRRAIPEGAESEQDLTCRVTESGSLVCKGVSADRSCRVYEESLVCRIPGSSGSFRVADLQDRCSEWQVERMLQLAKCLQTLEAAELLRSSSSKIEPEDRKDLKKMACLAQKVFNAQDKLDLLRGREIKEKMMMWRTLPEIDASIDQMTAAIEQIDAHGEEVKALSGYGRADRNSQTRTISTQKAIMIREEVLKGIKDKLLKGIQEKELRKSVEVPESPRIMLDDNDDRATSAVEQLKRQEQPLRNVIAAGLSLTQSLPDGYAFNAELALPDAENCQATRQTEQTLRDLLWFVQDKDGVEKDEAFLKKLSRIKLEDLSHLKTQISLNEDQKNLEPAERCKLYREALFERQKGLRKILEDCGLISMEEALQLKHPCCNKDLIHSNWKCCPKLADKLEAAGLNQEAATMRTFQAVLENSESTDEDLRAAASSARKLAEQLRQSSSGEPRKVNADHLKLADEIEKLDVDCRSHHVPPSCFQPDNFFGTAQHLIKVRLSALLAH